jgi:hypothetical protein
LEDLLGVRGQCRKDNINSLGQVSATDSVHYTKEGYENLANAIDAIICTKDKISAGYRGEEGDFHLERIHQPRGLRQAALQRHQLQHH